MSAKISPRGKTKMKPSLALQGKQAAIREAVSRYRTAILVSSVRCSMGPTRMVVISIVLSMHCRELRYSILAD